MSGLKLASCSGLFVLLIVLGMSNPKQVYSQTDEEPNNEYTTASPWVLGDSTNPGRNTGHMAGADDAIDYWTFTTEKDGEIVKIAATFDTSLRFYLRIYDSDGATLIYGGRYDYGSGSSPHVFGPFGLKKGTYYIKLSAGDSSYYGNYTLDSYYAEQQWENDVEPDDNFLDAKPMAPRGITTGHLGYRGGIADSQDWWSLTPDCDTDVKFTANFDNSLRFYLRIYDSDGATLIYGGRYDFASGSSPHVFGPFGLSQKTYYVKLSVADDNYYGGYHFVTENDCPGCGDGITMSPEECDDGNNQDGDCCSATCKFELVGSPCDDGFFCNTNDTCNGSGICQPGLTVACPDDGIYCNGTESCLEATDSCVSSGDPCAPILICDEEANSCKCDSDTDCSDGLYCNGAETCNGAGICQAGSPINCPDDGLYCNGEEYCREATDSCASSGNPCPSGEKCYEFNDCCNIWDCLCPLESLFADNPETLNLLREYRDNVLSKTPEGQELIKLYYQWSPFIVQAMEQDEQFKEELKAIVNSALPLIKQKAK
jgi:cysteine-rich repeat protein